MVGEDRESATVDLILSNESIGAIGRLSEGHG